MRTKLQRNNPITVKEMEDEWPRLPQAKRVDLLWESYKRSKGPVFPMDVLMDDTRQRLKRRRML